MVKLNPTDVKEFYFQFCTRETNRLWRYSLCLFVHSWNRLGQIKKNTIVSGFPTDPIFYPRTYSFLARRDESPGAKKL